MLTIYGIPNCDTVKKARKWLEQQGINYTFHDYKSQGLSPDQLAHWLTQQDWTILLNMRGTSWRELAPAQKEKVQDAASAAAVMLENLSMIKRPVVEKDGQLVLVGFDAGLWEKTLSA